MYGCGAIGGLLAARLAGGGHSLTVIARGEHLATMRRDGIVLMCEDERVIADVVACDSPAEAGEQDVVFLCMKSHTVPAIAADIAPLFGDETLVLTACNGIPWWYFYGTEQQNDAPELQSVDAGQALWNAIGPERAIGCVVYPAARIETPGIVRHVFGNRFALGEPDGNESDRIMRLSAAMTESGFEAPVVENIRSEMWTKLVANAAFNPVSLLTGKTLGEMIEDKATRGLLEGVMSEVVAVADAYGVDVAMSPEQLLEATRALGGHKTSMLQDYESGRTLELGPIVEAVAELANLRGVAVPNLNIVLRLVDGKIKPVH
ncbi:MAG: 2-dehydropantoate 2-reductase [Gammaproteobacteria bacterium]